MGYRILIAEPEKGFNTYKWRENAAGGIFDTTSASEILTEVGLCTQEYPTSRLQIVATASLVVSPTTLSPS